MLQKLPANFRLVERSENGRIDEVQIQGRALTQTEVQDVMNGSQVTAEALDVTIRRTYMLAGQAIATKVTGDDNPESNGTFFLYSDHLGSTSVLVNNRNSVVAGSDTRHLPFGGYRVEPTHDITDRGYTGHLENRGIGLTYMNARFYLPYINRFLTADTIVPDSANPQSLNRYSYVYNRPLNLTDPSGHDPAYCADQYESQGDPACNHSYPSLINFTEDDNVEWTQAEMLIIIQAANEVANQMADTVNAERAIGDRLSPKQVFSRVFGGSVVANKANQSCTVATDCVASASLTEVLLNFTQLKNRHLFIHELFHTFDLVILDNDANQTLFNEQTTNGTFPNRPDLAGPSDLRWGFAGRNFSEWQKSRSGVSGEEFADMGIGWTYGQWQSDADGLTVDGQARADFMDNHMLGWILDAMGE